MQAKKTELTPGKIYMICQVGPSTDDWAELLTKQYCKGTGTFCYDPARNGFSGTWEQCKAEALRREAYILSKKAA